MTAEERTGAAVSPGKLQLASDSRLQAVFLQHRLVAGLPPLRGVTPATAKFVLGQIVDRLLAVPGGLEPLMLLERDQRRLAGATSMAVLAVVLAHAAGWPSGHLPDLGAAALLAEIGPVLDERAPAAAAFRWLLDRGSDDFWLRCALVARHALSPGDPTLPHGVAGIAVVRLAAVVRAAMAKAPDGGPWWPPTARHEPAVGSLLDAVPAELAALVPAVFAAG